MTVDWRESEVCEHGVSYDNPDGCEQCDVEYLNEMADEAMGGDQR